jgi:uncharacterized protein (TIGR03435 family)
MTKRSYACLMRMRRSFYALSSILLALASVVASAQTAVPAAVPVYDAAVIKPNKSGSGSTMINTRDDTFAVTNGSLKLLLVMAYGIRDGLISGLPAWADSARFDINAKIVDYDAVTMKNIAREQRRAMLQALLVSRFHVKVHTEIKTLPVYELVVAKDGLKITAHEPPAASEQDHPLPPGSLGRGGMNTHSSNGVMGLTANAVKLENLTNVLSNQLDRNVIDKTGLTGEYDLHLKWTPDNAPQPIADDAPPLLFTAIQEQLGLKLQPGKGPVDTLVVDHVDQPTEN